MGQGAGDACQGQEAGRPCYPAPAQAQLLPPGLRQDAQLGRLPGLGTQGLWTDAAALWVPIPVCCSLCNNCWATCPPTTRLCPLCKEGAAQALLP